MLQDIALTCQSDINAIGRRASLSIQSGVDEATVQQALSNASDIPIHIGSCCPGSENYYFPHLHTIYRAYKRLHLQVHRLQRELQRHMPVREEIDIRHAEKLGSIIFSVG